MLSDKIIRARLMADYVNGQFLALSFATGTSYEFLKGQQSGMDLAQMNISQNRLRMTPIPLPPLAEQHRIVAKVDELMAICDQFEERQTQRNTTRKALQVSALDALANAETPDELATAWKRVHSHWDVISAQPESIGTLRQAILQLAVRGKLVPQDPDDEPASVLLERIEAEKTQLVKAGKLKKYKPVPPIGEDEIAFDLPLGWEWVSLGDLLVFGPTNGYSPKAVDYATPVKSLTLTATTSGIFDGSHFKYIDEDIPPHSDLWLNPGDILIQRGNTIDYVGTSAVYQGLEKIFIYPDLMMKIRLASMLCVDFIHRAINCPSSRDFIRSKASGTSGTMPKINQLTLRSLPIPLPPTAEQHRIVAKVDELMAICDELKARLLAQQDTASELAAASVYSLAG